jgi:hypothetical protein
MGIAYPFTTVSSTTYLPFKATSKSGFMGDEKIVIPIPVCMDNR